MPKHKQQNSIPTSIKKPTQNHVNIYYFHGNNRCKSCHLIEIMTKDTVQNNFKNELNSKTLIFKTINVEKPENTHFIKDYRLYNKTVLISLFKNNQEIKHKNLDKIWPHLRDPKTFKNYIKSETKAFLNKL